MTGIPRRRRSRRPNSISCVSATPLRHRSPAGPSPAGFFNSIVRSVTTRDKLRTETGAAVIIDNRPMIKYTDIGLLPDADSFSGRFVL